MVIDRFNVAAESEPGLCRWYEEVYIPQLKKITGVISVRGFELVKGSEKYMVLHYLSKNETDMGQAWREWRTAAQQKWRIPNSESYRPLSPTFFSNAEQKSPLSGIAGS